MIEFTSESTIDVTITLVGDTVVEGDEWFIGSLRRFNNKGIILTMESINITIKDDDSKSILSHDSSMATYMRCMHILNQISCYKHWHYLQVLIYHSLKQTTQ